MNNFLEPILTSNSFDLPFLNSSLNMPSTENTPISFQKKFMSKMESAMQVISFEDENLSNQPTTLYNNNNQTSNIIFNENHHPIQNQNIQITNIKTINFSLNFNQNPFERTQNLLSEGLNLTDIIGETIHNDNVANIGTSNINICIS